MRMKQRAQVSEGTHNSHMNFYTYNTRLQAYNHMLDIDIILTNIFSHGTVSKAKENVCNVITASAWLRYAAIKHTLYTYLSISCYYQLVNKNKVF